MGLKAVNPSDDAQEGAIEEIAGDAERGAPA